jgi:folate-binding protein YgfZ
MTTLERPDLDAEYRQLREECGLLRRPRAVIAVAGPDAAEFLQGQVTNDIEALGPGDGCYAALLDRKGHVQADMYVICRGEGDILLDAPEAAADGLFKHLSMYKVGRDVDLARTGLAVVSLIGPGTPAVSAIVPGPEFTSKPQTVAGADCLAVSTHLGVDLICEEAQVDAVISALEAGGAVAVSEAAAEVLRVEAGRPALATEMANSPMPAEAGIVERAVSFTKGCYIGQEPVARLHYKGRPNRFLRGLRTEGPVSPGDPVRLEERELGSIGTFALSPASGRIALAILRKEAEPGSRVEVGTGDGTVAATVTDLPFAGPETPDGEGS